jgi:hypothetical protein
MTAKSSSIVTNNIDIIEKLTFNGFEDEDIVLLQFRGLIFALIFGEFL